MSLAHVGPSEPLASDPMEDIRASRWWNPMVKWVLVMIALSLILDPWLFFYCGIWITGIGRLIIKHRTRIVSRLDRVRMPRPLLFVLLGVAGVLVEETLAATAFVFAEGTPVPETYIESWSINIALFTPALVAWTILLRRYRLRPSVVVLTWGLVGAGFESAALALVTLDPVFFFSFPLEFFAHATVYALPMLVMRRHAEEGEPVSRLLIGVAMFLSLVVTFALTTLYTTVGGREVIPDS